MGQSGFLSLFSIKGEPNSGVFRVHSQLQRSNPRLQYTVIGSVTSKMPLKWVRRFHLFLYQVLSDGPWTLYWANQSRVFSIGSRYSTAVESSL